MRSSSIKSLSIATAIVVALAAAPRVEAKTKQPRIKTTLTQLISRYFGIRTQEDYPQDPIPKQQSTRTSTSKEEVTLAATTPQ
jgi:hypothetical protein